LENKPKDKPVYRGPDGTGKGDKPRTGISPKEWGKRWEKVFREKKKK